MKLGKARGRLYPLQERLQGRRFLALREDWTRLQYRPPEELRARQEDKLRRIYRQAREHVPYYAERFAALGLGPDDIRSLDDWAKLPVLSREDVRRHFPGGMAADNVPRRRRILDRTSGSTGVPMVFFRDREARDAVLAGFLLFDEWAGIKPGDRTVHIGAPQPFRLRSRLAAALRGHTDLAAFDLGDRGASEILSRLEQIQPALIEGYASALFILAQTALRRGIRLRPRAVVATSDTLPAADPLERAFGCRVFNRFGNREICGALAQDCGAGRSLHVNTEICVLEIVDGEGRPARDGERGRVVVTDLRNRVMPLLRLDTGDMAVAGGDCGCGRGFPLLRSIEGRGTEFLVSPGGLRLSPVALGHFLFVVKPHAGRILKFQARQSEPGRVAFRFVPMGRPLETLRRELIRDLKGLLGDCVEVEVEWAEDIPAEPGGKRPIVKSSLTLPGA
jgi:phenylacetate-CoA ligase